MILRRGKVPKVPHTEFRVGGRLALEEIHGTYGFSGPHSRKMHLRYPTVQAALPVPASLDLTPRPPAGRLALQPYHIRAGAIPHAGDAVTGRIPLVYGPSTTVSAVKPKASMPADVFFRNGDRHELWFVQDGTGVLETEFGALSWKKGHYVVVPKATTCRWTLSSPRAFLLLVESVFPIVFAPHHLNAAGQATLMAPIVETEVEAPEFAGPVDRLGRFRVLVKHDGGLVSRLTLAHHPFDLIGWEGALYPFAFPISSHHGIAREMHTAPPIHQTFQAGQAPFSGFSICSFVPQIEGWHPKEVPAPYAHHNVDSDECMFFSNADYGARKGVIEEGSLTFHPGSLPHSPHGRAAETSLRDRGRMSGRLAVMLDTFFESLRVTAQGRRWRDLDYALSWARADGRSGT